MNGFSGNWSPENNGADFPGPGFWLHRYGFHQERIKTSQGLTDKDFTYIKYLFLITNDLSNLLRLLLFNLRSA
jgi:hypothetical protein